MGLPNVFNIGRSSMQASKAAIGTAGHNIANANTEGYSRQRVQTAAETPRNSIGTKGWVGDGVRVNRVERFNDEYLEKQIRNSQKDLSHAEEKEMVLKQTEDIFNEMNGEGLNRVMAKFFNEFRKLANEPESEAIRHSVRESSQAMINDFKRLRSATDEVRRHIDSRIEGYSREINMLAQDIKDLNMRINLMEQRGGDPNDLLDKRDAAVKQLGSYMDIAVHKDKVGAYTVDIKGVGPLVVGPEAEKFSVFRTPADDQGKVENALDVKASSNAKGVVTHQLKGGKLGALLESRDQMLSTVMNRLDELAYGVAKSVNEIHRQGFNRYGMQGVEFFQEPVEKFRAAEMLSLSDAIQSNVNNIAAAAQPDAPADNRIAIALSGIQGIRFMNEGKSTVDDYFNSMVSDVGVLSSRNRSNLNQQKDIVTQMNKMREQISGVSLDEETANLLQFQHTFDASAHIIRVADEMLKTVLSLRSMGG